MKKLILFFGAAILTAACNSGDKKAASRANGNDTAASLTAEQKQQAMNDSSNFTTLEWIDPVVKNLGKLMKDQSIEITYRFKNTGSKNLVIENVSAPCGCTIPEKPEQPIAPGEEGVIKAKYNGSGKGTINKTISVRANTSPAVDHTLTFTGEIQEN